MAPVFAEVRSRRGASTIVDDIEGGRLYHLNNMKFIYHVGVDFRHILSGLRHINEVIEYCRYKAGDRSGHRDSAWNRCE